MKKLYVLIIVLGLIVPAVADQELCYTIPSGGATNWVTGTQVAIKQAFGNAWGAEIVAISAYTVTGVGNDGTYDYIVISGDQTALCAAGRRLRIVESGLVRYMPIQSSVYSTETTVKFTTLLEDNETNPTEVWPVGLDPPAAASYRNVFVNAKIKSWLIKNIRQYYNAAKLAEKAAEAAIVGQDEVWSD